MMSAAAMENGEGEKRSVAEGDLKVSSAAKKVVPMQLFPSQVYGGVNRLIEGEGDHGVSGKKATGECEATWRPSSLALVKRERGEETVEVLLRQIGQMIVAYHTDDESNQYLGRESPLGLSQNFEKFTGVEASAVAHRFAVVGDPSAAKQIVGGQLDVYDADQMKRIVSLTAPAGVHGTLVTWALSPDGRYLAAFFESQDEKGGGVIVIWGIQKSQAAAAGPSSTLICPSSTRMSQITFCPSSTEHITTTSPQQVKIWHRVGDGTLKAFNVPLVHPDLQPDHQMVLSHTWTECSSDVQTSKMVVLLGGSTSNGRSNSVLIFKARPSSSLATFVELSQYIALDSQLSAEIIAPWAKGFLVGGAGGRKSPGLLSLYSSVSDGAKEASYTLTKTLSIQEGSISHAVMSSALGIYLCTSDGKVLQYDLSKSGILGSFEETTEIKMPSIIPGGHHAGKIMGIDVCPTKPILVTVGSDDALRLWNYAKARCEYSHAFSYGDTPICVSLHPSGMYCAVLIPARVVILAITEHGLQIHKEVSARGGKVVSYSRGGALLAISMGLSIQVLDANTLEVAHMLAGHISTVTSMTWGHLDGYLASSSSDGDVNVWDMRTGSRIHLRGAEAPCSSIEWFGVEPGDNTESTLILTGDPLPSARLQMSNQLSLALAQGPDFDSGGLGQFFSDVSLASGGKYPFSEEETITSIALATSRQHIFCGSSAGMIRAYTWPPPRDGGACLVAELPLHRGAVTSLKACIDERFIFSCGHDGALFCLKFSSANSDELDVVDVRLYEGVNFGLCALENLDEMRGDIECLRKELEVSRTESEYALQKLQSGLESDARNVKATMEARIAAKEKAAEELQAHLENAVKDHAQILSRNDALHVQVLQELEGKHEHRLAVELDRYDRLSEELEAFRQHYDELLHKQQGENDAQLRERDASALRSDKELRLQIERMQEEKKYNDQMYKKVLEQQEQEYEKELQQLMTAAQAELGKERAESCKLQGILQARKTNDDQQRKKMQEIQEAISVKQKLLDAERDKSEKLEGAMADLQREIGEREVRLAEKDASVEKLEKKNATLENFRFVLDHRLNQLMEERGPLAEHVSSLESHIKVMYDELVAEFRDKKEVARVIEQKDSKIAGSMQEIKSLQGALRAKERIISGFKRDVSTLVSLSGPRELEAATTALYKKHVRGETVKLVPRSNSQPLQSASAKASRNKLEAKTAAAAVGLFQENNGGERNSDSDSDSSTEDNPHVVMKRRLWGGEDAQELAQQALEAHRQREFIEKRRGELKGKLADVKRISRRRLQQKQAENVSLLDECNELRRENIYLKRSLEFVKSSSTHSAPEVAPCSSTLSALTGPGKDEVSRSQTRNYRSLPLSGTGKIERLPLPRDLLGKFSGAGGEPKVGRMQKAPRPLHVTSSSSQEVLTTDCTTRLVKKLELSQRR